MDVFKVNRFSVNIFKLVIILCFGNLSAQVPKCEITEDCNIICRQNAALELKYNTPCNYYEKIEFQDTDINSYKLQNLNGYSYRQLDLIRITNIQNASNAIKGLNTKRLRINHSNIKELETDMFEKSKIFYVISLSWNNIRVLQRNSIPMAKWVYLRFNLIKTVTVDMFVDISFVENLNLSGNLIKIIKASLFRGLKAFNLDLSYNQIEYLEDRSIPEVQNLFLNNNKLKSIHSQMFVNVLYTKVLEISYNNISNFNFQNCEFEALNMSYNKITKISQNSLACTKILTNLSLSNNLIESLEMKSIPTVEYLNLSYNLLTSIESNMFSDKYHLRYLDLSYNCIDHLNLNLIKQVLISLGFLDKNCISNNNTNFNWRTTFIVGISILVAVVVVFSIIFSRCLAKLSKKVQTSNVLVYDCPSNVPKDTDSRCVISANEYEVINDTTATRESNEYMVPRFNS